MRNRRDLYWLGRRIIKRGLIASLFLLTNFKKYGIIIIESKKGDRNMCLKFKEKKLVFETPNKIFIVGRVFADGGYGSVLAYKTMMKKSIVHRFGKEK